VVATTLDAPVLTPEHALEVLAKGSRSFSFAGWFLPPERRADAAVLYAFCRLVDDTADDAPSPEVARAGLAELDGALDGRAARHPVVNAALEVSHRRGIDLRYCHELIEGVRTDTEVVRIEDDRALLRYCYRVASTVGLMMCGVLGVTAREALPYAIDLGVGMQLTNIARDVAEDARLGRVYLPATRLRAQGGGTEPQEVARSPEAVRPVVADLLVLADRYYESAEHGLRFIPWRARLAIVLAARIYRAIGLRLLRSGGDPLRGRTVVPLWEKFIWAAIGVGVWLGTPWKRRPHAAELHVHLAGLPGVHEPSER
jgi:phytoene synthase